MLMRLPLSYIADKILFKNFLWNANVTLVVLFCFLKEM